MNIFAVRLFYFMYSDYFGRGSEYHVVHNISGTFYGGEKHENGKRIGNLYDYHIRLFIEYNGANKRKRTNEKGNEDVLHVARDDTNDGWYDANDTNDGWYDANDAWNDGWYDADDANDAWNDGKNGPGRQKEDEGNDGKNDGHANGTPESHDGYVSKNDGNDV
ncbi:MAG: hypothetical protein ACUBOA_12210 [Candidatus Loosdrechtia sp.]